jgi:hypothetical protein
MADFCIFPGMLFRYFPNAFKIAPIAPTITGTTTAATIISAGTASGMQHHALLLQKAKILNFDATDIFKTLVYFCYTVEKLKSVPSAKE